VGNKSSLVLGCSRRARAVWSILLVLVLSSLSLPSRASSQAAPLNPTAWPLSSVGRVNVITGAGSRSQCTGTLVGPRHVLTAAHCLFNETRQVWVHPSSVHFVAGYARSEFKAHSDASAYVKGEHFVVTDPPQPASAAEDWAVIELSAPMSLKPIRVRSEPLPGTRPAHIVRAGYRGDRAHVLTIQQDCAVKAVSRPAPLLLHSCGAVHGESGSALLSFDGGEPEIIGILVAGSQEGAAPSIAVPAISFAAAVDHALRPTP